MCDGFACSIRHRQTILWREIARRRRTVRRLNCRMSDLILRTSVRRSNGLDDYDVLSDGQVVGRISLATSILAAPCGRPWMWTLACGRDRDRAPSHGFAVTREATLMAFVSNWRHEGQGTGPVLPDSEQLHHFVCFQ